MMPPPPNHNPSCCMSCSLDRSCSWAIHSSYYYEILRSPAWGKLLYGWLLPEHSWSSIYHHSQRYHQGSWQYHDVTFIYVKLWHYSFIILLSDSLARLTIPSVFSASNFRPLSNIYFNLFVITHILWSMSSSPVF